LLTAARLSPTLGIFRATGASGMMPHVHMILFMDTRQDKQRPSVCLAAHLPIKPMRAHVQSLMQWGQGLANEGGGICARTRLRHQCRHTRQKFNSGASAYVRLLFACTSTNTCSNLYGSRCLQESVCALSSPAHALRHAFAATWAGHMRTPAPSRARTARTNAPMCSLPARSLRQ